MSVTLTQARDAIMQAFYNDWNALAGAANGGVVPPVDWQGDDSSSKPDVSNPWARISIFHGISTQDTIGVPGAGRSFERTGTIIINVFTPLSSGQGLTQAEALATIARNAFEGKTAGPNDEIWFRNVSVNEIGPDGGWFQININADFLYPESK
jgi:hypothetical protein